MTGAEMQNGLFIKPLCDKSISPIIRNFNILPLGETYFKFLKGVFYESLNC